MATIPSRRGEAAQHGVPRRALPQCRPAGSPGAMPVSRGHPHTRGRPGTTTRHLPRPATAPNWAAHVNEPLGVGLKIVHSVAGQQGQPDHVLQIANRAQHRLHRVHDRMRGRGKAHNVIVVACARELSCFLWAAERPTDPRLTAPRSGGRGAGPSAAGTRDLSMGSTPKGVPRPLLESASWQHETGPWGIQPPHHQTGNADTEPGAPASRPPQTARHADAINPAHLTNDTTYQITSRHATSHKASRAELSQSAGALGDARRLREERVLLLPAEYEAGRLSRSRSPPSPRRGKLVQTRFRTRSCTRLAKSVPSSKRARTASSIWA